VRSLARGGEEKQFNPVRRAAGEQGSSKDSPRPPRDEAARLAAAALARLATVGSGVRSLTGDALVATLPFLLEAKPPKAPKTKPKPARRRGAGAPAVAALQLAGRDARPGQESGSSGGE
jgi:hypothetical protein